MNWLLEWAALPTLCAVIGGGLLVVLPRRRIGLGLLALQYVWVGWLAGLSISPALAAVKVFSGWLACALLALNPFNVEGYLVEEGRDLPGGRAFRMIAVLLVLAGAIGLGRSPLLRFPGVAAEAMTGALVLGALGLLQVGLAGGLLDTAIGLLTLLGGFEILYAALEKSLLVLAMLASVHLAIALAVSVLMLEMAGGRAQDQRQ
jgi:hypothetical protein